MDVALSTTALGVSADGLRRTFGRRTTTLAYAVFVLFAGFAGPQVALLLAEDNRGAAQLLALATALAAALVPWRTMRLGVVVDRDRVIVRNWATTTVIPVEEIVRFHPPSRYDRWAWSKLGLRIERRPGLGDVYCSALYTNRFSPDFGQAEAAELNMWCRTDAYRPPLTRARVRLRGARRACGSSSLPSKRPPPSR